MFRKLRTQRSNKTTGKNEIRSIFRKQAKTDVPHVEPTLTMTLSEDSADMPVSFSKTKAISIPQDSETTITFTQKQVMQNQLNHMRVVRELSEKQQELSVKQQEIVELKAVHSLELSEKQEEVIKMKAVLEELKSTHAKKLAEKDQEISSAKVKFEKVLNDKDNELVEVRMKFSETKEELVKVSVTLIACQHELHEQTHKSWLNWL